VLGDALGLSPIHVNRVLRQLREMHLLTLHKGTVKIDDLNGLRKLASFGGRLSKFKRLTGSITGVPLNGSVPGMVQNTPTISGTNHPAREEGRT